MIVFNQVNKFYGDFQVLKDINLTINQGEVVVNRSIRFREKYSAALYQSPGNNH